MRQDVTIYSQALQELRRRHQDEFNQIRTEVAGGQIYKTPAKRLEPEALLHVLTEYKARNPDATPSLPELCQMLNISKGRKETVRAALIKLAEEGKIIKSTTDHKMHIEIVDSSE